LSFGNTTLFVSADFSQKFLHMIISSLVECVFVGAFLNYAYGGIVVSLKTMSDDEAAYPFQDGESLTDSLLFRELRKHQDFFGVVSSRGVVFAAPRSTTVPDVDRSTIGLCF
jgi:hypothetical protein